MIRDSPAAIRYDFFVNQFASRDTATKNRDGIPDVVIFRKGAASAEIADSPATMLDQCFLMCLCHYLNQVLQSS